ncbi:HSP20-like chaperone [Xylariaceae sp. FL0016]|nr:HSP20-like chaperone [Xylariaceae sp. FL0016]
MEQDNPSFWEFLQSFDPNSVRGPGAGVDHQNRRASMPAPPVPESGPGFPFEQGQFGPWGGQWGGPWAGPWGGPWRGGRGGHGRFGRRHHHEAHEHDHTPDYEHDHDEHADPPEQSPDTVREGDHSPPPPPPPGAVPGSSPPPPPPGAPHHPPHHPHPHHHHGPPFGPRGRRGGRGGRCGRGGRGGRHPPPPPPFAGPFDFRPLMHAFSSHPFAQAFREYSEPNRRGDTSANHDEDQHNSFSPPIDVFNTEKAYVLHVSLPGTDKNDIGINWDGEKLNIAGVRHRPGDEQFLNCLLSSETKVGMFERSIKLPPQGSDEKEDIEGYNTTAKMENGILIVTVPKAEKEWTEIHKIDIE